MLFGSALRAAHAGTRTGRLLRLPLTLLPRQMEVRVIAGPLRGARWLRGSGPDGYWVGLYEPDDTAAFASFVSEGSIVWDVGAHVGYYTLLALRRGAARVLSVEPMPRNRQLLQRHLELNRLSGRVRVADVAISDRVGEAWLAPGATTSEGKLVERDSDSARRAECLRVRTTTLDELLADGERAGDSAPVLVKLDIEGAEADALAGGSRLLAEARPALVLSLHGPDEVSERALSTCERAGYAFSFLNASQGASRGHPWGTAVGHPFPA
jgi:FkbM family methyltransferase